MTNTTMNFTAVVARVALVIALMLVPGAGVSRAQDHAGHQAGQPAAPPAGDQDHTQHQAPPARSGPEIPPITDADRAAAFPDVEGHTVHDESIHAFVLFDQLEWQPAGGGAAWDARGWIGRDRDRFWFRTEGGGDDDGVDHGEVHLLYGRAIARWWEVVAGIRQDVRPGPGRTWAAIGLQGLAPYWFEIEATAYIGESGRTHVRLESEYELLLTNRLILQPRAEMNVFGKSDPDYGIGAGLSSIDVGLRLRYEWRREVAPYAGVVWTRKFFDTADLATAAGAREDDARLTVGLRLWF